MHGLGRRVAHETPERGFTRISLFAGRLHPRPASLESYPSVFHIFSRHGFDECYHLAAQSFVAESFADGFSTMNTNINGTHYVLAALRELQPQCRFYFAGSSGQTHAVREFCRLALAEVGPDYEGYVKVDEQLYRPAELDLLVGDAAKARAVLSWRPTYTSEDIIREMVQADLEAMRKERMGDK